MTSCINKTFRDLSKNMNIMKKLQFLTIIGLLIGGTSGCNNPNGQTADNSVEQAQGVNDTTAMVNQNDVDFAVKAADAGLAEIELGKLAQEKASDPRIRDFAKKMVNDHQEANDELMTIASRYQITLPPVISEDHVDKQHSLREKTGVGFDNDYMDMMVRDHDKVVTLFEDASEDVRNSDLQAFASKILPILKKHYEEAKAIRDSINPMDTTTIQRIIP